MHYRRVRCALVAAAVLALVAPAGARADAVTQWNANARTAIFAGSPTAHASTLSFAMVQGAVYDAVNAIAGGYQAYLVKPEVAGPKSIDAAVAAAAYQVLLAVAPASQATTLTNQYNAALAAIADGEAKTNGISVGEAAAAAMLAARANDGRNPSTPFPFVFGTSAGVWRVSFPLTTPEPTAWVGNVTPFLIPDVEMLRLEPPPALTSAEYAEDFNEVKTLGALVSSRRTQDQTNAAIFWQSQPLGLYGGVMQQLSERFNLSTPERARLFAMVSLAAADGAIGCWNNKYYWNFWRPIDAIRLADTDGNPSTEADPSWTPLFDPSTPSTPALATPNFPDYPSGHSCVSSAVLHTMQNFFGTDKPVDGFDIVSTRFPVGDPRRTRHYDRFSDALKEIIDARVWGGIHFRTADTRGAVVGKKVAQWEWKHYFQPAG